MLTLNFQAVQGLSVPGPSSTRASAWNSSWYKGRMRRLPPPLRLAIIVIVLGVVWYQRSSREPSSPAAVQPDGGSVESLFDRELSDRWVEFEGRVVRLLPDDNQGSRHQKFIVELASGHTVLVSHNIDLAPRVELARDDRVQVRGEYEWNDRGGVVHWTHRDPQGRIAGGWVRLRGREYR